MRVDEMGSAGEVRYSFLDGLRAIAALAVLFHHLYNSSEFQAAFNAVVPGWFSGFSTFCARGVQIFFVLSGFVIAYSLRNTRITPGTILNFVLRRQIRLDPPFWICLTIATIDLALVAQAHPNLAAAPTASGYLANMLYLPWLLNEPAYLSVAWTLCLEVQFYLVFILLLWAGQRSTRINILVFLLGLSSLVFRANLENDDFPWFIGSFYLFATGVLVHRTLSKQISRWLLFSFTTAMLLVGLFRGQETIIVGWVVATLIYSVGAAGHLRDWLSSGLFRYFARISYSLYLVHVPILVRVYRFGLRSTGEGFKSGLLWLVIGALLSVVAAHLLNRYVEQPAMRLSIKLKPRRKAAREPVEMLSAA